MSTMLERAEQAGIPVHPFDLENDERWEASPQRMWDEATSIAPLFYSPVNRGYFVATDFETVKTVLRDVNVWSSAVSPFVYTKKFIPIDVPPLSMDAPQHTSIRHALIPLFSPQEIAPLEPMIDRITVRLIDDIEAKGSCEFNHDFAAPLPSEFFLTWFGLEDLSQIKHMYELAEAATYGFTTPEERKKIDDEIAETIRAQLELRRRKPANDLATKMVNLRIDGELIEPELLASIGRLVFIAGQDTTVTQLGFMLAHMAQHPEDRRLIVERPEIIPDAIEELLRYYNTGGPTGRTAKTAGTLRGVQIEPGDRIFIARSGGDRALGEGVDLTRSPNRHTAFGLGVHRCIGSHVARLEMQLTMKRWHERFPDYSLPAGFKLKHRYGTFMQDVAELPLEIPGVTDRAAA